MKFNNLNAEYVVFIERVLAAVVLEFNLGAEVEPCLVGLTPEGALSRLPIKGAPKDLIGQAISFIKDESPIIFVTEAWISHVSAKPDSAIGKAMKEDPDNVLLLEPRTDPNRIEAVMVQFFSKERHIFCTAEIQRHAQEAPTLGEWKVLDNAESKIHRHNFSPPGARLASGIV